MGHLGADRMIELAREYFFWPRMNNNIRHFIGNIYSCVKQKKVKYHQSYRIKGDIPSVASIELVNIDFLHLDTCTA